MPTNPYTDARLAAQLRLARAARHGSAGEKESAARDYGFESARALLADIQSKYPAMSRDQRNQLKRMI